MKASSATSARARTAPRPTGRSSAKRPPTPTRAEEFVLAGPSDLPDPEYSAYRKDLADVALAARLIASHYAEPIDRKVEAATVLRSEPSDDGEVVRELRAGDQFALLDDSLGWAWGYAGEERRVGYVKSGDLAAY